MDADVEARLSGAIQAVLQELHRVANDRGRTPDSATDIPSARTPNALMTWAHCDLGRPRTCSVRGTQLIPRGEQSVYSTEQGPLGAPIDFASAPVGRVVWALGNCSNRTALMGVVRLYDGNWMMFRQLAVTTRTSIVFETDNRWMKNRRHRAERHS